MKQIHIAKEISAQKLEKTINAKLKEGWKLHGLFSHAPLESGGLTWFFHALVKSESEE